MRVCWRGLLGLALLAPEAQAAAQGPPGSASDAPTLYFFFSPLADSGAAAARKAVHLVRLKGETIRLRPVILIETFAGIGKLDPSGPFTRTLQELQTLRPLDLPLVDEEGLRLAEAWELRAVPAFVLVRQGRAHRTLGPESNLEELFLCRP